MADSTSDMQCDRLLQVWGFAFVVVGVLLVVIGTLLLAGGSTAYAEYQLPRPMNNVEHRVGTYALIVGGVILAVGVAASTFGLWSRLRSRASGVE